MKKIISCAALVAMSCGLAVGQTYKVLYSFGPSGDGGDAPNNNLVHDRSGNLYGTTYYGGVYGGGNIFELSPNADGTWTEVSLYSFCNLSGGACPVGALPNGLTIDAKGSLYGTAQGGGLGYGGESGVAFELSPPGSPGGAWTYSVLYNFCSLGGTACLDGASPSAPLTVDKSGNLFGTAQFGGQNGGGTAFEISPTSSGWTETVIYNFCADSQGGYCLDGMVPQTGLTFDKSGNLYGTTSYGGSTGPQAAGALYKLSPGFGGWSQTVLANFSARSSQQVGHTAVPGPVSIDFNGNLYSTQTRGGLYGAKGVSYGGVDRLSAEGKTRMFAFDGTDGDGPYGVLIDERRGLLYGASSYGGAGGNYFAGNVYQLDRAGNETVLYNFCSQPQCTDGVLPLGGLIEDQNGDLYGATYEGGAYGIGVVYEIIP